MPKRRVTLSFSGCGFLGIYHAGVVSCFREFSEYFHIDKVAGCSAGALAAVGTLCGVCLGQSVALILDTVHAARSSPMGTLSPRFNLTKEVRKSLRKLLPSNAHEICQQRLRLSVTRCYDGKNVVLTHFDSRDELIEAIVCSAFVPFFSGIIPPMYRNIHYWDGSLSDNLPAFDEHSITVSPFSGESDICPSDASAAYLEFAVSNHHVRLTANNFFRFAATLFPPPPHVMEEIYRDGYKDAMRYMKNVLLLDIPVKSLGFLLKNDSAKSFGGFHTNSTTRVPLSDIQPNDTENTAEDPDFLPSIVSDFVTEVFRSARITGQYSLLLRSIQYLMLPWIFPLELVYVICIKVTECVLSPRRTLRECYRQLVSVTAQYEERQRLGGKLR